jgi:hypothetical protein
MQIFCSSGSDRQREIGALRHVRYNVAAIGGSMWGKGGTPALGFRQMGLLLVYAFCDAFFFVFRKKCCGQILAFIDRFL